MPLTHFTHLSGTGSGAKAACRLGTMPFLLILVTLCAKAEAVDGVLGCLVFHLSSSLAGKPLVLGVHSHAIPRRDCVRCGVHLTRLGPLFSPSISALLCLVRLTTLVDELKAQCGSFPPGLVFYNRGAPAGFITRFAVDAVSRRLTRDLVLIIRRPSTLLILSLVVWTFNSPPHLSPGRQPTVSLVVWGPKPS